MKLIEVRIYQPAQEIFSKRPKALDSMFNYPNRWRFVNCWLNKDKTVTVVGGQGDFKFVNGRCKDFVGMGEACIVGEIDASRSMEADRFIAAYEHYPSLPPSPEDVERLQRAIQAESNDLRPNLKHIELLKRDMAIAASLAPQTEKPR